jgi:hypothetical protein
MFFSKTSKGQFYIQTLILVMNTVHEQFFPPKLEFALEANATGSREATDFVRYSNSNFGNVICSWSILHPNLNFGNKHNPLTFKKKRGHSKFVNINTNLVGKNSYTLYFEKRHRICQDLITPHLRTCPT